MTKKIFVDSHVVYDLLSKREPFYPFSAALFTLAEKAEIKVHISALTIANLNYILSRQKSREEARQILRKFKLIVSVLPMNDKILDLALNSDFEDLEDAIQYYTAIENKIKILITRNLNDFKSATIPVMTAEEYVKLFNK